MNRKFTECTGYRPEEVVGRNPRVLNAGRTSPELYRELWSTITQGGEWHGEFCNKKKNGETQVLPRLCLFFLSGTRKALHFATAFRKEFSSFIGNARCQR